MAALFVVEDGTGLETATSYLSETDMKQLWDNAGYDYSALASADIEVLLNNATLSLDGRYGEKWPGTRGSSGQALDWPRSGVDDRDGYTRSSSSVPSEIETAVSELAYSVNAGTDVDPESTNPGDLKAESVTVEGAIKESKEYFEGSSRTYPEIPKVENALRRLLGTTSKYGAMGFARV